jgi:uncharacterized protein
MMAATPLKVLFTGMVGAGKTTAIAALSEIAPVTTEANNSDSAFAKANTTVAMDYGEFTLEDGQKVMLYGTPGQMRFDFMWKILGEGALGVIVLIDNSRPDPVADFAVYLEAFTPFAERGAMVVALGRTETHPNPEASSFADLMEQKGLTAPVFSVDVRRKSDVLMLVDALLMQLESNGFDT